MPRRTNPWLKNPRTKKMVKPHLRVTKKGVEWIDTFLHEYPKKIAEKLAGKIRPKKKEKEGKIEPKKEKAIRELKDKALCMLGMKRP